jgi:hypothetical protein
MRSLPRGAPHRGGPRGEAFQRRPPNRRGAFDRHTTSRQGQSSGQYAHPGPPPPPPPPPPPRHSGRREGTAPAHGQARGAPCLPALPAQPVPRCSTHSARACHLASPTRGPSAAGAGAVADQRDDLGHHLHHFKRPRQRLERHRMGQPAVVLGRRAQLELELRAVDRRPVLLDDAAGRDTTGYRPQPARIFRCLRDANHGRRDLREHGEMRAATAATGGVSWCRQLLLPRRVLQQWAIAPPTSGSGPSLKRARARACVCLRRVPLIQPARALASVVATRT